MYTEMHDCLLLIPLDRNEHEGPIENMKLKNKSITKQNSRGEFELKNNRLAKADQNFFHPTKHLYNNVSLEQRNYGEVLNEQ